MTNEEKIEKFKRMSKEELRKIARNTNSSESDFVIASIELGHKEIEDGNVYTTEEVMEHIFGKDYLVNRCR